MAQVVPLRPDETGPVDTGTWNSGFQNCPVCRRLLRKPQETESPRIESLWMEGGYRRLQDSSGFGEIRGI